MLATLLARKKVPVLLLEQHQNFDRDFRGDTVHPSTLELLDQLGWVDELLKKPHGKVSSLRLQVGGRHIEIADFSTVPHTLSVHRADSSSGLPRLHLPEGIAVFRLSGE